MTATTRFHNGTGGIKGPSSTRGQQFVKVHVGQSSIAFAKSETVGGTSSAYGMRLASSDHALGTTSDGRRDVTVTSTATPSDAGFFHCFDRLGGCGCGRCADSRRPVEGFTKVATAVASSRGGTAARFRFVQDCNDSRRFRTSTATALFPDLDDLGQAFQQFRSHDDE